MPGMWIGWLLTRGGSSAYETPQKSAEEPVLCPSSLVACEHRRLDRIETNETGICIQNNLITGFYWS